MFLGVAFIAGSYVLTDTINTSFDEIFDEAYEGTDVAVSSSTTGQDDSGEPPPFPAALPRPRARRWTAWRGRGRHLLARPLRRRRRATRSATASRPTSSAPSPPEPFETLTYIEGRPPQHRRRGLDRHSHRRPRGPRDRRHAPHRRRGAASSAYRIVGLQRLGDTASGGAGTAQLTLPEAQRITDKRGRARRDLGRRPATGVSPRELRAADRRACCRRGAGRDRPAGGRAPVAGHQGRPLVLPRWCCSCSAAWRCSWALPDLQHLLDHRRPAHPRVRAAAHARRHARPDARSDGARGARCIGVLGVGARRARRASASRPALNALFKSFGIDLPNTGTVIETRTIIVALVVGHRASRSCLGARARRCAPRACRRWRRCCEAELPESRTRGRIFTAFARAAGRWSASA